MWHSSVFLLLWYLNFPVVGLTKHHLIFALCPSALSNVTRSLTLCTFCITCCSPAWWPQWFPLTSFSRQMTSRWDVSMVAIATYLHPLSMGLHVEDDAGVGFGQSISVWDPLTGDPQLHFGQTGTAEQTQSVGRWLVDVTHGGGGTRSLRRKKPGQWWSTTEKCSCQFLMMKNLIMKLIDFTFENKWQWS